MEDFFWSLYAIFSGGCLQNESDIMSPIHVKQNTEVDKQV